MTRIENRYIGVMRGLDVLARSSFGVEVIDHDYAPDHDPQFHSSKSLVGYQRELDRLYDEIPDEAKDWEFMRRNIESTDAVITAIPLDIAPGGASLIPLPEYVELTMGVRPEIIPEKTLRKQKSQAAKALGRLGYDYEPDAREEFHSEYAIPGEQMRQKVLELADISREDLLQAAGSEALSGAEEPLIKPVESSDTWQGYFGTDEKRNFKIEMNTNPLLNLSETEERVALVHERAHALSSATSKQRIDSGELSPAAGLVLCASPMYFQEEVIARAVEEYMLRNQNDDFAEYVRLNNKYKGSVGHNMILMANSGYNTSEVVEYASERLPMEKRAKIQQDVQMYTKKLVYKTVFAVDSKAIELGQEIAALPDERRQAVIASLCQGPLNMSDLISSIRSPK